MKNEGAFGVGNLFFDGKENVGKNILFIYNSKDNDNNISYISLDLLKKITLEKLEKRNLIYMNAL